MSNMSIDISLEVTSEKRTVKKISVLGLYLSYEDFGQRKRQISEINYGLNTPLNIANFKNKIVTTFIKYLSAI